MNIVEKAMFGDDVGLIGATLLLETFVKLLADFFFTTGDPIFRMVLPILSAGIACSLGDVTAIVAGLSGKFVPFSVHFGH